ncbi:MAG TPA: helix-turn-helix transcriptional regulator [Acidimicrobiales bacterium]|nr:helix-turn-helix transcriptional regulator [Acidimicrobiales bacterium]
MSTGVKGFDPTRLTRLRRSRGLTQERLAALAKVRREVVSDYERGAVRPSPRSLAVLSRALGTAPHMLLDPAPAGLERLRVDRGLTQAQAAAAIGISQPSYRDIERTGRLSPERARALARALATSLADVRRAAEEVQR